MRIPVLIGCAAVTAGLVLAGLVAPYGPGRQLSVPTSLRQKVEDPAARQPLLRTRRVAVTSPGFQSWALLNTRTKAISGSDNLAATSDTASMVKAWLAADYLRQTKQNPNAARMRDLSIMIRDSDNDAAERIYKLSGGTESIRRLIRMCRLTDSRAVPDSWSETRMSPRDAVRMGACIADGRAAGPKWTKWILSEMRKVRGDGRFGIVTALPAKDAAATAIKNGWLLRDNTGQWHVSCLAVGDGWVLAVMLRYPGSLGFEHGGRVCESVAEQLLDPAVAGKAAPRR